MTAAPPGLSGNEYARALTGVNADLEVVARAAGDADAHRSAGDAFRAAFALSSETAWREAVAATAALIARCPAAGSVRMLAARRRLAAFVAENADLLEAGR